MSELPLLSELPQEGKLPLSSELLPVAVRVILESSTLETSNWDRTFSTYLPMGTFSTNLEPQQVLTWESQKPTWVNLFYQPDNIQD